MKVNTVLLLLFYFFGLLSGYKVIHCIAPLACTHWLPVFVFIAVHSNMWAINLSMGELVWMNFSTSTYRKRKVENDLSMTMNILKNSFS